VRSISRIAVLRALKLGDLLCTVPALRALRVAHPFAEIRLVGLPWSAELVHRYDMYLDGLFELPGFPSFPEVPFDPAQFVRFLDRLQIWGPDLVLQLHGSGEQANPLAMLLGGQVTAGYYRPGAYCPDPDRFIPYPDDLPEVRRPLRLLERLGIRTQGTAKELPVYESDRHALTDALADVWLKSPYVVIHPGASVPERRWPADRFAGVADTLATQGLSIVLTGSEDEIPITSEVRSVMRAPAIDLTGRTTLGTLAALLSDAALLVSNDTGVMHVADAVGTPLVAVSFDPEYWRWAPEDRWRCTVLPGGDTVGLDDVLTATRQRLCIRTGNGGAIASDIGQTSDARVGRAG
jgi:ADP-heptose:LPS heptosyltransferase